MNKKYTGQKLTFLAVASTLTIMQSSDYMNKINADELIPVNDGLIADALISDMDKSFYFEKETVAELNQKVDDYILQKKLEEEERIRLESLKTYIYISSDDLRVTSDIKVEELSMLLQGTKLQHLAQDYIDAQNTYGVNALFLAALTANESGWGTSWLAENKNNLTGYAAYPGKERDARHFSSKRESIMETAKLLSNHYLNPNGKYHNGYSLEEVNIMYCQFADGSANYGWSNAIKAIMTDFARNLKPITEELKEDADAVSFVYFNGVEQY